MKLAIIILSVLLLVAVLTCLSMWAAVSQYRTECRQWRTECQDVKKKYDNEVEHREWALSHLKAQTTRAEYLQAQINKAAAAVKECRNNKNKKKNNEQ